MVGQIWSLLAFTVVGMTGVEFLSWSRVGVPLLDRGMLFWLVVGSCFALEGFVQRGNNLCMRDGPDVE